MSFPFLRRARWVTDKYILLMLGLFPLFTGWQGYSNITASKFWYFAAATCLWAVIVLALIAGGLIAGERYKVEVRPAQLAIGVFLAVGAVSACLSEYGVSTLAGANRFDGYLTTLLYGLIFFGVSWLGAPRRRYAWALGISTGICCAIAVLQLFGLDPFGLYPDGTDYFDKYVAYNGAFLGTLGNTGQMAAFLVIPAGLLPIYAVLSENRWDKLLLIPAALTLVVIALIDVDAGVVAVLGCAIIAVPVAIQKDRAAAIAGGVSGGIAGAGLITLYLWQGKSGTLYEMSQVLHGHLADSFGSARGEIWKQGWRLFTEKPWLGGGPGTASLRFDIRWFSEVRNQTVVVTNAHNVYLGYLVNVGILGLLPYLAAIGASMVTWVKRRKLGAMYPALGAALLGYLIQDFFGLGLPLTAPIMWVIWGLLESDDPEEKEAACLAELPPQRQ